MEDLMDMILTDESPSQISDTIKSALFAKSAERFGSLLWPRFGLSSRGIPRFRGPAHDYLQ